MRCGNEFVIHTKRSFQLQITRIEHFEQREIKTEKKIKQKRTENTNKIVKMAYAYIKQESY